MQSLAELSAEQYIANLHPSIVEELKKAINAVERKRTRQVLVKINTLPYIYEKLGSQHNFPHIDITKFKQELINVINEYFDLIDRIIKHDHQLIWRNKLTVDFPCEYIFETYPQPPLVKGMLQYNNDRRQGHIAQARRLISELKRGHGSLCGYLEEPYSDIYVYSQYDGDCEKCNQIFSFAHPDYRELFFDIQNVPIGYYVSFETYFSTGEYEVHSFNVYPNAGQVLEQYQKNVKDLYNWHNDGADDYCLVHAYYQIK